MNDSLFKEVDNALNWYRIQQFWHRSAKQIILIVATVLIALIALQLYKQQRRSQSNEQSDILLRYVYTSQPNNETSEAEPLALNSDEFTGSLAQLAQFLIASQASAESLSALIAAQNAPAGSPLLSEYACLLRHLSGDTTAEPCSNDSSAGNFAPLLLETQVMELLAQNNANQALMLLDAAHNAAPKPTNRPPRLAMLHAYVRSHSTASANTTVALPAAKDSINATPSAQ